VANLGAEGLWSLPGFVLVSIVQKAGALFYYVLLLSACARLGEPVWYTRAPWIARFAGGRASAAVVGVADDAKPAALSAA
jgi:hypothetical protein